MESTRANNSLSLMLHLMAHAKGEVPPMPMLPIKTVEEFSAVRTFVQSGLFGDALAAMAGMSNMLALVVEHWDRLRRLHDTILHDGLQRSVLEGTLTYFQHVSEPVWHSFAKENQSRLEAACPVLSGTPYAVTGVVCAPAFLGEWPHTDSGSAPEHALQLADSQVVCEVCRPFSPRIAVVLTLPGRDQCGKRGGSEIDPAVRHQ